MNLSYTEEENGVVSRVCIFDPPVREAKRELDKAIKECAPKEYIKFLSSRYERAKARDEEIERIRKENEFSWFKLLKMLACIPLVMVLFAIRLARMLFRKIEKETRPE